MHPVKRRGARRGGRSLIRRRFPFAPFTIRSRGALLSIHEGELKIYRAAAAPLDQVGDAGGAILAEQMLCALFHRQQSHDPLLGLDDAAIPGIKMNSERLRESAHNIVDESEALFAPAAWCFV